MKKTITSFSARAAMTLLAVMMLTMTAQPALATTEDLGGYDFTVETDDEGSYYVIDGTAALNALASYVNAGNDCDGKRFKMTANIEYDKNQTNNYTPIGDGGVCFMGTFDGQGHTISGISMSDPEGFGKAIFGYVYQGTVKNLVVSDCSIVAYNGIGGIVTSLEDGTIENCQVGSDVTLTGNMNIGGIAGGSFGGNITGCTSAATITGTIDSGCKASYLGGIAGATSGSTLTNNLFDGTIGGELLEYIGAIVGENDNDNYGSNTFTNNVYTFESEDIKGVGAEGSITGTDVEGIRYEAKIVTQDNFYSFFDEYGCLLDNVTLDELIFQGEFSNSNNELVPYIYIYRPITITGDNAVLNDMGFIIAGNDVTLDNLTLVANSNLGNLIDIAAENVVISNSNITYVVTEAANAINLYNGANGVQILNNTIYFESTVDEYTVNDVTNAICVNSGVSIFDDDLDPIEGLVIDGNKITAVIPAFLADIYEHEYYVMGISAVNGIRINGAEDFEFTNNILDVTTNRLDKTTPTYQAMYVASSSGLIDTNDISMIDEFTSEGKDVYLYALELVNDGGLIISNNNFNLSTDGGKEEAGTACAIVAIASDFDVDDNIITTVSKGPNVGIYFPSMMGAPCVAVISGNFIKVTGLATAAHEYGLVSGIEIETGDVEISGNTINTYNIGEYAEDNYIYGISYALNGLTSDVEITDNTVITEGHYAISFREVDDAVITRNTLYAHELTGDAAVYIADGSGNTVEKNQPVSLTEDGITDAINNEWKGETVNIAFGRTFGALSSGEGKASTVCLPFELDKPSTTDVGTFYTFSGVSDATGEYVVTMTEVTADNLSAGTPYMFKPATGDEVTFQNTAYNVPSTGFTPAGTETDANGWEFKGTYSRLDYGTAPFSGKAFGFAAKSKGEGEAAVQAGEFVRAATGAYIPAFRAFLTYSGDDPNLQARATRSGGAGLPDRIAVRLIGKDGETQGIGEISLSTGEVTFDGNAWYDLNGRRLDGKPTEKGIYINGGHKVVIK